MAATHSTPARITQRTLAKAKAAEKAALKRAKATDSFQNFALNLGIGTDNALSGSTYGFNPVTRVRTLLEWVHRGSWLGGVAVDLPADDMTRAGVEINSTIDPKQVDRIQQTLTRTGVWAGINDTIKWSRLYGGCVAVMLIEGQDPKTPLNIDTVGKDQFKGLLCLDRWMIEPSMSRLIRKLGPELGLPEYYFVTSDAPALPRMTVHYTRVLRMEGLRLPYWQRVQENLWGLSVLERLYDRMVAFDSATQGAAQLVYKSYIRTYKVDGMRELVAAGGPAEQTLVRYVEMMRRFQGIEGITLLDGKDDFVPHSTGSFAGIGDALIQFGQQLSGALQIPLVRLFGQSPAGLNSTGESDLRTYYDGIAQKQEQDLREGMNTILRVVARSEGVTIGDDFGFNFRPLWQLSEDEKSQVSQRDTQTVIEAEAAGLIDTEIALKELKTMSKVTGRFTNITDETIESMKNALPQIDESISGLGPLKALGAPAASHTDPIQLHPARELPQLNLSPRPRLFTQDRIPYSEVAGLPVVIETRRGDARWPGAPRLPADYGYIRRVGSNEGATEWMDCFVGDDHASDQVWVVDMRNPDKDAFEEHKVMLGFRAAQDAVKAFQDAYADGAKRVMGVTHMSLDDLREWMSRGEFSEPLLLRMAGRGARIGK